MQKYQKEDNKEHPCIRHDKKFPNNPIICFGSRCSNCPYTNQIFIERLKKRKELENIKAARLIRQCMKDV
jgi:hypothetical protein